MRILNTLKKLTALATAITALGVTVVILDENYMQSGPGTAMYEISSPDLEKVLYPSGYDTVAQQSIGGEADAAMPAAVDASGTTPRKSIN